VTIPRTILEITKQPVAAVNWEKAAVIFIDLQNEYTIGKLALGNKCGEAISKANELLTHSRKMGAPVFHVVHHGSIKGSLFNPQGTGVDIVPEIEVLKSEPIIVKNLPNSFINTNLRELIDAEDRSHLVFAGFMSHMCVSSTVRDALDKGYTNFVCHDACYTRDLRNMHGKTIPSELVHESAMAALQDRFSTVSATSAIIAKQQEVIQCKEPP